MRQVPFLIFSLMLIISQPLYCAQFLTYDFDDLLTASVSDETQSTGVTLIYFPKGAQAAIDIRGGSVGTFFTSQKMAQGDAYIDGIALCGGGILGLQAVSGVTEAIFQSQDQTKFEKMPLISGAVIFDYTARQNKIYPTVQLGKEAFSQLRSSQFCLGSCGVGTSATVGKLLANQYTRSGQGAAFEQIGKTKIAVFTVVNSVGVVVDGEKIVHPFQFNHTSHLDDSIANLLQSPQSIPFFKQHNTTLTVVVTNEKLSSRHLQQLAKQVHHGLSEVIYPYATILDGDLLYMVSTGTRVSDLFVPGSEIETDFNAKLIYLGIHATRLAKQAVWRSVGYFPSQ